MPGLDPDVPERRVDSCRRCQGDQGFNQIQDAENILAQSEVRHLSIPMFWEVNYQLAFLSGIPREVGQGGKAAAEFQKTPVCPTNAS